MNYIRYMLRPNLSIRVHILLFLLFTACDSDKPTASDPVDLSELPYSIEAQDMALYYSGEMYPPEKLTRKISHELERIRTRWKDVLTEFPGARFETPWQGEAVGLRFDSATAVAIHAGTNTEWNNYVAQNNFIVSTFLSRFFYLRLPVKTHPERLAEQIEAAHLHGVTAMSVQQKPWPRIGNIARVEGKHSTKYFFYSERCPDIYFAYAYFEIDHARVDFHGYFYECPNNSSDWWHGSSFEALEAALDSIENSRPTWVDTARVTIRFLESDLRYQWSGN